MGNGLNLTGRLVKIVEPEQYTKRDKTLGESYPALIILADDATVKVEYRDVTARDDALIVSGCKVEKVEADGSVATLPGITIPCRPVGPWDGDRGIRLPVTYAGR